MLRRALAYASVFAVFFGVALTSANAGSNRHAALILDANTGAVLHNADADAPRHPASLTKMMTLYLTFETLQSGRLKMSDRLTISDSAASVAPSKLDLDPGEQIAVSDAIRALITKSANDIAVALAERIGGSETNFARLMNTRARELGMLSTHYENASGLPNDEQITTARDMATLAIRLQDDFPQFYPLFATRTFTYGRKTYRNHNTMLSTFAGVDGIKTGYTRASGFNLVTSWRQGERHLVGVVFGGDTAAERNAEMRRLLTRTVSRASSVKTRKPVLVARLKAQPKIAERPAKRKQPVAVVAEAPPVALQQAEPAAPASTAEDDRETPVQIFKVRAVPLVAKPRPAPPTADETTDMESSDRVPDSLPSPPSPQRAPEPDRIGVAAAGASQIRAFAPTGLSNATVPALDDRAVERPRAVAENRVAQLGSSDAPSPAITASIPRPVEAKPRLKAAERKHQKTASSDVHEPPVLRGLPPSTLGAQARALGGASGQGSFASRSSQPNSGGRYAVQIGAYGSIDDAQRALTNVQDRAGRLLAGVSSVTNPAMKDGHQIFRARFTGLDANRATTTCNALRRQSVDCFVMAGD